MTQQIPGVPEGWELVEIDRPAKGEWFIDVAGRPKEYPYEVNRGGVFPIIRKIEKPAKYRPFKDAEEYRPHRDRWLTRKDKSDLTHVDGACRVVAYCDTHVWWSDGRSSTYKDELDSGRCFDDDGTPFGVRIDE